jgi:serine/threonine-protein kinase
MEKPSEENCQTCFRLQEEAGAPPKTQWVSICRCDRPFSPNSQFSIDVCAICKKRVAAKVKPVMRLDLCSCEEPEARKIAAFIKQNETDPVTPEPNSAKVSLEHYPSERYSPIAFLGDTSRATVILCRDKERGTRVAVKCFKNISPSFYSAFESELRKNKMLSHTNIAKILDFGIHNGKAPYVVTEYKDGFNLEQCLSLYGLPSYDVAVKILIATCETLLYSGKQGVMHRDVRPGNIIFLDDLNSEPTISLTDFALPKVKAGEQLSDRWQTLYMSADEARGLDYSEKSEVYSLACVGYSLLAGRPPFEDATALDMKNSHALKLPPRISTIKFDPKRPKDLEEVIEKCLEKDPRDRFESIAKFQERLEVFPRRVQMQINAVLAARKKAKLLRICVAGLIGAAVCFACFLAFMHH